MVLLQRCELLNSIEAQILYPFISVILSYLHQVHYFTLLSVWSQFPCAVCLYKSESSHDCELQTELKVCRKVWVQLLLLVRMSNLIRGCEDESGGTAAAAHLRTQEHYYKILSKTDRSGLAQSELASGDLSQADKHLLLPGGHSVASVCGLSSVLEKLI